MLKKIQRHIELGNQKYIDYIQPANQDVFEIFNDRLSKIDPLWYTKEILDFGCNVGHLLTTSDGKINPKKYTGVDVHKKSLDIAKSLHPNATWIHYNGYNSTFNPDGNLEETFKLDKKPEIIIVYGVFTHCDFKEILRLLEILKSMLSDKGIIVFSAWEDIHFPGYLDFLKFCFNIDIKNKFVNKVFKKSLYLINREDVMIDENESGQKRLTWLETFYKREFILNSIPNVIFLDGTYSHHSLFLVNYEN